MYKTWTASRDDGRVLARELEAHLNEFAAEVVSVSYAVSKSHYVLAVYRPVDSQEEAAVTLAEQIIDQSAV
jgi:hypothetical protein